MISALDIEYFLGYGRCFICWLTRLWGFDLDTILEVHGNIVNGFVGLDNVSNDGFDGTLSVVGLYDPIEKYGAVEGLIASDEPWLFRLCIYHHPTAAPTSSLGYFMLLLNLW